MKNNEFRALEGLVYDGHTIGYPKKKLTLCQVIRSLSNKRQYQVHVENGESNLFDDLEAAVDRFLLLRNK